MRPPWANTSELRGVNRAGPAVHGPTPTPAPLPQLSAEQTAATGAGGAEQIDVRGVDGFAAAHIPEAL